MNPLQNHILRTRREFLTTTASGLGLAAFGSLLTHDNILTAATVSPTSNPLSPKRPHFPARAKRCIFIFMEGGPSQMDLFYPKPKLNQLHGQPLPDPLLQN